MLSKLVTILGIAATAGEDEAIKAVESRLARLAIAEEARNEAVNRALAAEASLAAAQEVLSKQNEDKFIEQGLLAGKINPGSKFETSLRAFHRNDPAGAAALLADAPVINPVGKPRQTVEQPAGAGADVTPKLSAIADQIRAYNSAASIEGVIAALTASGHANASELVVKHLGKAG